MRRTNLIPQEMLSMQSRFTFKTQSEYMFFIASVALFAILIVLEIFQLFGIGIFNLQINARDRRLSYLSRQLSENTRLKESIDAQVNGWRGKASQSKDRITFLENEVKQNFAWSSVLEKLNRLIPSRLWLTKLSLSEEVVKIKGETYDNLLISNFITYLSDSGSFGDMTLDYAQKKKTKDGAGNFAEREVIEFEITCRLTAQANASDKDLR